MDRREEIINEMKSMKKRNRKLAFEIAVVLLFAAIVILQVAPVSYPATALKPEDVAFVSQSDLDFQAEVMNVTGYDWPAFLSAGGGNNSKVAALLLLANEIDALEDNFAFVNRSAGLSKKELPPRLNATNTSKDNFLKLVGNVKAVNNVFYSKGLESAKIRANRLSAIENFFARNELPQGEASAQNLFAEKLGMTVDDYTRLVSLMVVNYNLFLRE